MEISKSQKDRIVKFGKTFDRCPLCMKKMGQQDDEMGTVYAFCGSCHLHVEQDYV